MDASGSVGCLARASGLRPSPQFMTKRWFCHGTLTAGEGATAGSTVSCQPHHRRNASGKCATATGRCDSGHSTRAAHIQVQMIGMGRVGSWSEDRGEPAAGGRADGRKGGSGAASPSGLTRRSDPFASSKPAMSMASPSAWADSLPVSARLRLRHSKPSPVWTLFNSVFRLPATTGATGTVNLTLLLDLAGGFTGADCCIFNSLGRPEDSLKRPLLS